MSRELEDRIGAIAVRQHGVVTYPQLLEAGVSRSAIHRRLRSGRLRALHRGVYLELPFPLAHTRQMAAVLASGPRAVLSHLSAIDLLRPQRPGRQSADEPVDVTVVGEGGRRRRGVHVHRVERLPEDEWTIVEGIPVTTPARTILDVAGVLDARELETLVARAQREGLVTREALSVLLRRHGRRPGAAALRAVLEAPGGPALTRSAAEAKFLELVREAGLPLPEANVSVGRYEIDFLWRAASIAVEVDGFRYHSSRERFEGDRRRDARLLARGIAVLRLTWRQIAEEPLATVAHLAQALARAEGNRR